MDSSNTGAHTYWINGKVKINGTDLATINEVDGAVLFKASNKLAEHAGSRPHVVEIHTTGGKLTVKVGKATFKMHQLVELLGFNEAAGFLDDGITAARIFSVDNSNLGFGVRPTIELLISGYKSATAKKVEIHATRAILIGDYNFNMDKDEFAKEDLEFQLLGDTSDEDTHVCEIRDEDLGS